MAVVMIVSTDDAAGMMLLDDITGLGGNVGGGVSSRSNVVRVAGTGWAAVVVLLSAGA